MNVSVNLREYIIIIDDEIINLKKCSNGYSLRIDRLYGLNAATEISKNINTQLNRNATNVKHIESIWYEILID